MQHDHVLEKLNFDLLTPGVRGVCGLTICYQVAAFVILFDAHRALPSIAHFQAEQLLKIFKLLECSHVAAFCDSF